MKIQWKELKPIISAIGRKSKQYLAVLDEQGNILLANSTMIKELNLKNPRQVRSNFFSLLHPEHVESFRNAFQYSVKNDSPYSMELNLENGHCSPIQWQVNYLSGKANGFKTFLCQCALKAEDTTGLKQLMQNNNAGEIFFQAFMKNTPNLIWVADEESNLVFANDVFSHYFRLDEKALNKKIVDLLPRAVADFLYEKHQKVFQTNMPVEAVEKGKSADGSTPAILSITIFPFEDASGKRLAGGIAINQADKYYMGKKLATANERLKQITGISSDAIWEWDMMTGKMFRNEKLMEMIGYQAEGTKGLSWWLGRVHPEDRDQLNDTLKEVTDKSLQSWQTEYRFLCADGDYKNMLDRGFVIYENGMPVKMIGSLQDITEKKLMEHLLIEGKLYSQKEISETVIRVQELERNRIGHELHDNVNQILGTVKLFVGMLTPSSEEEKQIKAKSIEYVMMAIEEIRKLSKELVVPQLKGESLEDNINDIIDDIHLSTDIKIKFTYDHENGLLNVGKKITVFRIVQEQLKNILKYSKTKSVDIFLQCKDNNLQLVIKDYGVGFNPQQTPRGVGLSNIYERARFYNGTVNIQTAPGKGCTLMVTIPCENKD